ncbi:dihydrofolate synthase / folylpolyglutamate synthase [Hathewaya proteolytica DSM 3090]|uniref:tetrahydrofolate synthase n=1 Tax=Hathewaya proteolytica DSM 3090 TaxID=1121331 RepID=A0A1M6SGY5_9CLOT|nr:folylpolyglutamate synthase/dihydrofolate synthase family protein [Hathewaya proteolytica]SHK43758.1 dihydrofolate synthase / folylpolyglutamate synthase [Hathewaya proteolytica DSM 3090]
MKYDEAMEYLDSVHMFGVKIGLERITRLLKLLGNPQDDLKFIHIAGTNGKGSVTAMVSNILFKAGYKVGMFTSPYIEFFEERIQINNECIPRNTVAQIIEQLKPCIEKLAEEGYEPVTYFEVVTCMCLIYFKREKVDFAVMEVGMGGRMDPTNIINPLVSVITSISYDHMQYLGDTLCKIAFEKAGIIKEKTPVVIYPQETEVYDVIRRVCSDKEAPSVFVKKEDVDFIGVVSDNEVRQQLLIKTSNNKYEVQLNLLGTHQLLNCAVAVNVIELLQSMGCCITEKHIKLGLETVFWKGRLEILKKSPLIVIDGAHNIDAMVRLKESVIKYFKFRSLYLILGIVKDKEVEKMVSIITPMAKKVIAVSPHSDRATMAEELCDVIKPYKGNSIAVSDYKEAYKIAISEADEDDMILICGSLYMIGDMRSIILKY